MGSPAYLSPERVEGAEAGPESDVYALGALLYELLTGQPPFTGDARDVLVQHVIGEPVPPDRLAPSPLPPGTQALVLSMLAKDPAARPKGLRAVLQKWTS
jgi:serine/threonine protein kinase